MPIKFGQENQRNSRLGLNQQRVRISSFGARTAGNTAGRSRLWALLRHAADNLVQITNSNLRGIGSPPVKQQPALAGSPPFSTFARKLLVKRRLQKRFPIIDNRTYLPFNHQCGQKQKLASPDTYAGFLCLRCRDHYSARQIGTLRNFQVAAHPECYLGSRGGSIIRTRAKALLREKHQSLCAQL